MTTDSNLASNGIDSLQLLDLPPQSSNITDLAPSINAGKESSILDLLCVLDLGVGAGGELPVNNSNTSLATNNANNLLDGFSSPNLVMASNDLNLTTNINNSTSPETPASINSLDIPGIFGNIHPAGTSSNIPPLTVYEKNGVKIVFSFVKPGGPGQITINLTATGDATTTASDFVIQAAVPKSMQLQLELPSGSALPPVITQVLKINNPNKAALKMKLKISFVTPECGTVEEQLQLHNFPPELSAW